MRKIILFILAFALNAHATFLINGQPVPTGTYKEVVRVTTGSAGCTGTVVGKRVVVYAAHCGNTGDTATFSIDGVKYTGKVTRSKLYPAKDHDVAVIVTDKDIAVKPASVGGSVVTGKKIVLMGFGCVNVGGGGGNDGVLRWGTNVLKSTTTYDVVSGPTSGGAALCFGDSGGPLFDQEGLDATKHLLLGVNSKGNIKDTNYNCRMDTEDSKKFFEDIVASQKVDVCGVNVQCDDGPSPTKIVVENEAVKMEITNKGKHTDDFIRVNAENLARFLATPPSTDSDVPVHPVLPLPPEK